MSAINQITDSPADSQGVGMNTAGRTDSLATIWLSELLTGYAQIDKARDCRIATLRLDSRKVGHDDMFIALPGMTTDGRAYIGQAVANGASAVLFEKTGSGSALNKDALKHDVPVIGIARLQEKLGSIVARYFGNPSKNLKVIGITGSNGKTTTAYLIAQSLELLGTRCGYCGTVGNGFVDNLQPAALTTMDAIAIQAQLSAFLTAQGDAVSMEVSSHGLQQGRVNGVDFDIAIFTNLTRDHLDYHQSMTRYGEAKQKLFEFASLKSVVINSDDDFGRALLQKYHRQDGLTCVSYGMKPADWDLNLQATELQTDAQGIRFKLQVQGRKQQIRSRLLGAVNVPNVLATLGCLLAMGYELGAIASVIADIAAPPGRMEMFRNRPSQPAVVIDYAHTPDALEHALKSLKPLCRGNLIVIFGCGGDRDQGKRPQMGRIAQSIADRVIITDDNPRSESAAQIVAHIKPGLKQPVTVIHNRKQALVTAIESADSEDWILLAGKGHEQTQLIGNVAHALSDRAMVSELLEALP